MQNYRKQTCVPKGSMCMSCVRKLDFEFCKSLDFDSMKKISKPDNEGFVVVKCEQFVREANNE